MAISVEPEPADASKSSNPHTSGRQRLSALARIAMRKNPTPLATV